MIDRYLLPLQHKLLDPPARAMSAAGISANAVTVAGFMLGLMAVPALAAGWYGGALVLIVLNRIADGLDGAIARRTEASDRGAFIDIAFDFLFYALVPIGFALADPASNALPAAILVAAFVGTGSSFLAFAAVAAQRGVAADDYPTKGIYYLGGLTEGAETIAVFVAMCLFPPAFPTLAYVFSAACLLTTLTRWYHGWTVFAETDNP
ncbi:MAG: CDP-alcohol phosphatidyltransferase family protein [Rhodobacteraceae bacterium]|nr:CDP-alcohol phosphatidyltransferase family protein [Paracoccaceae bacterium]